MGRPQMTVTKRQREQKKRDRQQAKLERRAVRKSGGDSNETTEESLESPDSMPSSHAVPSD